MLENTLEFLIGMVLGAIFFFLGTVMEESNQVSECEQTLIEQNAERNKVCVFESKAVVIDRGE